MALQALIDGELEHVHTERRCIRKDGSIVWVHIIASTVLKTERRARAVDRDGRGHQRPQISRGREAVAGRGTTRPI